MTISINHKPADPSFVADGIMYQIILTPETGDVPEHKQIPIIFYIQEGSNDPEYITLLCFPSVDNQGRDVFDIEITDILSTLTSRYKVDASRDIVSGFAAVKVWQVGSTSVTDSRVLVLPGTSGGINLTGALAASTHPFLLARGMEDGSLHFYRSELEAMDMIYAFISNTYDDYHIETDNRQSDSADLNNKIKTIEDVFNLIGVWTGFFSSALYSISRNANALFVYYHYNGQYQIYSIAIMDDPDTDETYLIRWTNSMGAPEALLLTGELQDISEVEKPELYINSRSIRSTERKMQRGTVTTKYSLHTGYLTPARIIALKDMITSEEVEIQIDGQWVPVSVTTDPKHAVHQREPESFELTIEVLEQTRYHKPNRTVRPLPVTRAGLLQDNSGNIILDNNSNTIEENG